MIKLIYKLVILLSFTTFMTKNTYANPNLEDTKLEYESSWQKMPTIEAMSLVSKDLIKFKPEKGKSKVVIFLASWS